MCVWGEFGLVFCMVSVLFGKCFSVIKKCGIRFLVISGSMFSVKWVFLSVMCFCWIGWFVCLVLISVVCIVMLSFGCNRCGSVSDVLLFVGVMKFDILL